MSILGASVAIVIAITIPSVYYAISVTAKQRALAIEASVLAKSIETIIQARPDMWEFEHIRLLELISRPLVEGEAAEREVRTAAGEIVVKTEFAVTVPTLSASATFFDSGQPAGSIVQRDSIRAEIVTTAILGIISSLLGCLIYFIFRIYPIKKLDHALAALQREKDKLERHAVELKRANIEIEQYANAVCHDLRTPLVNLRGFTAELHDSLDTVLPTFDVMLSRLEDDEAKKALATIRDDIFDFVDFIDASAKRMGDLLDALLGLSRMGRRKLRIKSLDMKEIVAEVVNDLAEQIGTAKARVCVGTLPEIEGDQKAMKHIVGNILANAVKYLEPGTPGRIEISARQDETETAFAIRDNGRGIAKEDMPKVFALFRRAGQQNVTGEGMGMAYVEALIRRHNGTISCESELGVGTTFTFAIPHHLASMIAPVLAESSV